MRRAPVTLFILATICFMVAACSAGDSVSDGDVVTQDATAVPTAIEADQAVPQQAPSSSDAAEAALGARDSWLARGISTYSYTAQIWITSESENAPSCGSNGGQLTVRVTAGVPIEARVTDVPCVVDLTTPDRIPLTFTEWFNRLFEVGTDALGADFELGQFGEPLSMYSEGLAGSIQFELIDFTPGTAEPDSVVPTTSGGDLESARATWQAAALTDYEMTVERVCRCTAEFRGPFDIRVSGGAVVSVAVDNRPSTAEIDPDSLSVDGLLETVDGFADADRLDVIFDHNRGIPVVILADPRLGTADDEVELRVTRFEPLPRLDDPITRALVDLGSALDRAPAGTTDLDGARFCGVDNANWNSEFIGGDPIARACFADGVTRSIASAFVQAGPSIEGDPIITVMHVDINGTITAFTDSTQDEFGSGEWSTRTCFGINQRPDFGTNFFNLGC